MSREGKELKARSADPPNKSLKPLPAGFHMVINTLTKKFRIRFVDSERERQLALGPLTGSDLMNVSMSEGVHDGRPGDAFARRMAFETAGLMPRHSSASNTQ